MALIKNVAQNKLRLPQTAIREILSLMFYKDDFLALLAFLDTFSDTTLGFTLPSLIWTNI